MSFCATHPLIIATCTHPAVVNTMHDTDEALDVAILDDELLETPKLYALILHNDDYTTMEFVVWVLMSVLSLPESKAVAFMLEVHHHGKSKVAVLPKELAEAKQAQIRALAQAEQSPLLVTVEPE